VSLLLLLPPHRPAPDVSHPAQRKCSALQRSASARRPLSRLPVGPVLALGRSQRDTACTARALEPPNSGSTYSGSEVTIGAAPVADLVLLALIVGPEAPVMEKEETPQWLLHLRILRETHLQCVSGGGSDLCQSKLPWRSMFSGGAPRFRLNRIAYRTCVRLQWCRGSLRNLTLLCRYHHHNFLTKGWTCQLNPAGLPEWRPPRWLDPQQKPILNTRIQLAHLSK
jgi:hypothetical protein